MNYKPKEITLNSLKIRFKKEEITVYLTKNPSTNAVKFSDKEALELKQAYKLTDEWKDVFSAALKKQKVVPGLDGGFVVCGQSTSRMSKREFSDLVELIYAFGAERGVVFSGQSERMAA